MKKKLPWLKYDMKQAEYREAKEREKTAAKEFEKAAKLLNELKKPIEYVSFLTLLHVSNCLNLKLLRI